MAELDRSAMMDQIKSVTSGISRGRAAQIQAGFLGRLIEEETKRMGINQEASQFGIPSAGQNLSAETTRRGQDMTFGLGKERLGMERERYGIGNINAATSLFKPKKEIGGMGSVTTSPSSLPRPSSSFSDWWKL